MFRVADFKSVMRFKMVIGEKKKHDDIDKNMYSVVVEVSDNESVNRFL